jgi:hypothetical protein
VKSSRTNIPFKHLHKPGPRQSHSAELRLDRLRFFLPTERIAKHRKQDSHIPFKHAILTQKRGKTPSKSTFSPLFSQQNPKHGEKFKSKIRAK